MSKISTDFALFDVIDYKKDATTTTYNLQITPFTFRSRIPTNEFDEPPLNNSKVTFDFGDGTFGHELTSRHAYEYPGEYTVRMILRDCNNNAILASYSTDVIIQDYLTNTFTITGNVGIRPEAVVLSAGEFSNALTVEAQSPFYQEMQDIYFTISACDWENYFNLTPDINNKLKKYNSFYEKNYLNTLSTYEHVEIDKISLSSTNIYAQLSVAGGVTGSSVASALSVVLQTCLSSGLSSQFVGTTGSKVVFFKTDEEPLSADEVNIALFKDRSNIFSKGMTGFKEHDYLNNFNIVLSSDVISTSAQVISSIKISSNGITSEGSDETDPFSISPVQYKNLSIPFILTPKNSNNYTMKALSGCKPTFELLSGTTPYLAPGVSGVSIATGMSSEYHVISSLADSLSDINTDFWYRGLLTFNDHLSGSTSVITLSVRNLYATPAYETTSSFLSAVSGCTTFTCYPKNYYNFYKQNENFDFEETIKDLRFQEILLDKNILFTDFIGTIFGNVSSRYDVLGKTIWEKINNFVSNNSDIDYCDLNSLLNLSKMVDETGLVFDASLVQQPADIARLMSMFSLSYNNFRGTKNKFQSNFDSKGRTSKDIYGRNLGDQINSLTYEVTGGTDIVAYERFSDTYVTLNTYQPLCALSGQAITPHTAADKTYMLSSIRTEAHSTSSGLDWGWPLKLPSSYTIYDVDRFYTFYSLSAVNENTIEGGLIDYKNGLTTVDYAQPLSSLEGDDNIFDVMIRNSLFSSLSLF
jgi:hypothetical protein|tara:strand:- start:17044 stop:19305 length:2262 start_codon:yes stop_codon:yes gene_type:complete